MRNILLKPFLLWLLLSLSLGNLGGPFAYGQSPQNEFFIPNFNSSSWILMDYESGAILASKNMHEKLEPASITKIMTDYIVADEIHKGTIELTDKVTISNNAYIQEGSRMYIEERSQVSVEDLIRGLVIQSGNDAAMALAEFVAGSSETFVHRMNQKARELGMYNTHFTNPSGLPNPNHYSSAYDIALLSQALIHNFPDHYRIYSELSFSWNTDKSTGRPITQPNRNNLLRQDSSVDGIKTGHTESAGYCLASSAMRDDQRLIAVVLGTQSVQDRDQISQSILNFGFQNYRKQKLFNENAVLQTASLRKGTQKTVDVGTLEPIEAVLPHLDFDNIRGVVRIKNNVVAPVNKGDILGDLIIYLNEEELFTAPLVALETVNKTNVAKQVWDDFIFKLHNKYTKFKKAL